MSSFKKLLGILFILLVGYSIWNAVNHKDRSDDNFIVIGTGGVTGVYYPAGGAIQRLVNRSKTNHPYRVSVESTSASIYNINALHQGELDLAVTQADLFYYAYKGIHGFNPAYQDLRTVFALHPEAFTVVARQDSGINSFTDLLGKKVNIGNPGSGQRGTMELLMEIYGWKKSDFKRASQLAAGEQSQALCDNNLDAIIYAVGHPNGSIQEAASACKTKLINVVSPTIEALIDENPYYKTMIVPGGMYEGTKNDITTFGVRAMMVSSEDVSEEKIYTVVKAVFDNINDFRRLHPAFANLTPESMVETVGDIPFHPGALRYYREKGYIQ